MSDTTADPYSIAQFIHDHIKRHSVEGAVMVMTDHQILRELERELALRKHLADYRIACIQAAVDHYRARVEKAKGQTRLFDEP